MLPWLFNTSMDRCMRKVKAKVEKVDARPKMTGMGWAVVAWLFADDTVVCRARVRKTIL